MSQTAVININGKPDELILPELTEDQVHQLGNHLDMVRASCVLSKRAQQEPFYRLVKDNYIGYGSPLYSLANKMKMGQDCRKDIVEVEDETFNQFIMLVTEVAQDDVQILKMYGQILTDFGMMETAE